MVADLRIAACTLALEDKRTPIVDLAALHLNRAQAFNAVGNGARALVDFRETIRLLDGAPQPLTSDQHLHRGIARHATEQFDQALADYNEAIKLDDRNALAYVDRGILLATREGQIENAIADFDRALELVPDNIDTLVLRSDLYSALGEHARAVADLDRAVDLSPSNARLLNYRGLLRARRGERTQAVADYSAAIAIDNRFVDAMINRAALYSIAGEADKALADLDTALVLSPRNALAAYNRGYVHFAKREFDKAIEDYSLALEIAPALAWALTNRCLARVVAGHDLALALADCDEALRLQPANLETRETRGFIYLKLGDNEIALREYEIVLRADPDRPLALYGRGLARTRKGDPRGAAVDLAAARALLPAIDREFADYGVR